MTRGTGCEVCHSWNRHSWWCPGRHEEHDRAVAGCWKCVKREGVAPAEYNECPVCGNVYLAERGPLPANCSACKHNASLTKEVTA